MPNPTALSFLGIAKEATKGTGVVPTDFIPLSTIEPEDHINYVDDNSLRGSMVTVYGTQAGAGYSDFSLGGHLFTDTLGYLLAGLLGDVVTTGSSAPYSHVMSTYNATDGQPGSFSLTDYHGPDGGASTPALRYAGCQVTDISITWDPSGLVEHTSKATGALSTEVAKPSASFSTVRPQQTWAGGCKIAGSSVAYVESGSIDLKRNVSILQSVNNSQSPYAIFVGPLDASGKFTVIHETDAEAVRFRAAGIQAFEMDWTAGAGAALTELKMHQSSCTWKAGKMNRGKEYIEQDYTFMAGGNTTDAGASGGQSPIKVTLQSAKASGTYA